MADETLGASVEGTPQVDTNTAVDPIVNAPVDNPVEGAPVIPSTESQVAQPQLYTLKVAGVEKQLPMEEIIKLAQMGDDYTQKTQSIAQERKQFEAIQAKARELQKYGWDIDALLSDFNRQAIEAEATQNNVDPKVWGEFQNTKNQLSSVQNELNSFKQNQTLLEQKSTLADKPFFKDWESEVETTARELNTDYLTAYTLLSQQKLPDIVAKYEQDLKSAKDVAIKEYLAEKTKPQGIVESGGQSPVVETQPPKTFAEAKANSIALLKSMMSK